jgi:hypothetical protein
MYGTRSDGEEDVGARLPIRRESPGKIRKNTLLLARKFTN